RSQLADARRQRLNRLVAAVAGEQAATAQSAPAADSGRLRLVAPRHVGPDATWPPASVAAAGGRGMGPGAAATGGPVFGVLAMPAAFVRNPVVGQAANAPTRPAAAVESEAAVGAFGHLAAAPAVFPPAQPRVLRESSRA